MNIINPLISTSFGIINMAALLGLNPKDLSCGRRVLMFSYFFSIVGINLLLSFYIGQPVYGKIYIFVSHIPLYLGFLFFKQCNPVKLLFVLLSAVIFAAPSIQIMNTMRTFGYNNLLMLAFVDLITAVLTFLLIYAFIRKDFQYMLKNCESRRFWLFCAIPVLYYLYIFSTTRYNFQQVFPVNGYWVRQIPSLIVFLSYILLIRVFHFTRETQQLQSEKELAYLQSKAAEQRLFELNLAEEQTRQYRHDMRHHLNLLLGLAEEGNLEKIIAYLLESQKDMAKFIPSRYCKNSTANMIFSYYQTQAERRDIVLSVDAAIPQSLSLSETELCSLLSNSLENAISAAGAYRKAGRQKTPPEVTFKASVYQDNLLVLVENPFIGTLQLEDGIPYSPQKGHGYGTRNIASIAAAHGGNADFSAENGIFTLKLVIPLK